MSDQTFPDPTQIRHVIGVAGTFSLRNVAGDIRLRGVDADEVVVQARSSRGRETALPLVVRRGEGSLTVEIDQRGSLPFGFGWRSVPSVEFEVSLPRAARVEVNAVSSDIEVRDLVGDQDYRTVSGDLSLDHEAGRVTLTTVSGDARLVASAPIEPRVSTTSGDVEIVAPQVRALSVRTVSGDAEVRAGFDPGASHAVETVSGDVSITAESGLTIDVRRGMDLSGNGGRQRVVGDGAARLRFRSLSGHLELSGEQRAAANRPAAPAAPAPPAPPRPAQPSSLDILRALERGEIDIDEAARRPAGEVDPSSDRGHGWRPPRGQPARAPEHRRLGERVPARPVRPGRGPNPGRGCVRCPGNPARHHRQGRQPRPHHQRIALPPPERKVTAMLLTDVYYEAGRIEAEALRRPSWARPHGPAQAGMGRRGPRRVLGQALINLGQIIAADPPPLRRMAGQAQQ